MIFQRKYVIALVFLLLTLIAGSFIIYNRTKIIKNYDIITNGYKSTKVKRADIEKQVFVTGTLEPKEDANLAFEIGGKVKQVYVQVGDKVKKGQKLITLHSGDLWTQKLAQSARLEAEKARLEEIERGARPEELNVQKTRLYKTQTTIGDSENIIINRLREAYTQSEYVIYDKGDIIFSNPCSNNAHLNIRSNNSKLESQIKNERLYIGKMMEEWQKKIISLNSKNDLRVSISETRKNLQQIKTYSDKLALFITSLYPNSNLSQSTINTLKVDIAISRNNINTTISNLSIAEGQWNTSKSAFQMERSQLDLLEAGSTSQQITVYGAGVKSAEAQIRNINVQLAKTILYAPINGTITKQDITAGEIIPPNTLIVSIIGDEYEIEANIPEIDIAKIEAKNTVKIIFDAFEDRVFMGEIMVIEPKKKVIQGTTYYTAKIKLEETDKRFLPGMSVDLYVISEKRENTLVIPQEALFYEDNNTFVKLLKKLENDKDPRKFLTTKVEIQTGLRGIDGNIEVLEGLTEEDEILIINNYD